MVFHEKKVFALLYCTQWIEIGLFLSFFASFYSIFAHPPNALQFFVNEMLLLVFWAGFFAHTRLLARVIIFFYNPTPHFPAQLPRHSAFFLFVHSIDRGLEFGNGWNGMDTSTSSPSISSYELHHFLHPVEGRRRKIYFVPAPGTKVRRNQSVVSDQTDTPRYFTGKGKFFFFEFSTFGVKGNRVNWALNF